MGLVPTTHTHTRVRTTTQKKIHQKNYKTVLFSTSIFTGEPWKTNPRTTISIVIINIIVTIIWPKFHDFLSLTFIHCFGLWYVWKDFFLSECNPFIHLIIFSLLVLRRNSWALLLPLVRRQKSMTVYSPLRQSIILQLGPFFRRLDSQKKGVRGENYSSNGLLVETAA